MKIDVERIFMRLGIMQSKGFKTRIVLKSKNSDHIIGTVSDFLYDEDDTKVIIQKDSENQIILYLSKIQEVTKSED